MVNIGENMCYIVVVIILILVCAWVFWGPGLEWISSNIFGL